MDAQKVSMGGGNPGEVMAMVWAEGGNGGHDCGLWA